LSLATQGDQIRQQLVVPTINEEREVLLSASGLHPAFKAKNRVVSHPFVAPKYKKLAILDRLPYRCLQHREYMRADRIVLPLPLMEKVADVEEYKSIYVRLHLQLRLKALQTKDENVRIALRRQLLQGASIDRPVLLLPGFKTIDAQISRRTLPQTASLEFAAQSQAQSRPEGVELRRVQCPSPL